MAVVWDTEDLAKLSKSESDEFILDHKRDEDITIVIGLNRNLAIEVKNEAGNDRLIYFEMTIETNVSEHSFDMIGLIEGWINNSALMNVSTLNGTIVTCNSGGDAGSSGDFWNV